jgi:peptidoglycan/LPS O-acetylase OafA/YrhL
MAALFVAVAHAAANSLRIEPGSDLTTLKHWLVVCAGIGMPLFFVLSGFVIHYNYATRATSPRGVIAFFWARFSRLYPLYLLVIFGEVIFSGAILAYFKGDSRPIILILEVLPYYLTMTQSWIYALNDNKSLIYTFGIAVPLTWSISTGWFFYVCYPILLLAVRRLKTATMTVIAAVLFTLGFAALMIFVTYHLADLDAWASRQFGEAATVRVNAQDSFVRWAIYFSPYARIGEFVLGCLAAQLYMVLEPYKISAWEAKMAKVPLPLSIILIFVLTYAMYFPGATNIFARLKDNFGLAPAIAMLLFLSARYRGPITDVLSSPMLVKLGEASYSIYLIHLFIYGAALAQAPTPLGGGFLEDSFLLFRLLCMVALVLLISLGTYTFVEVPARNWLRKVVRFQ